MLHDLVPGTVRSDHVLLRQTAGKIGGVIVKKPLQGIGRVGAVLFAGVSLGIVVAGWTRDEQSIPQQDSPVSTSVHRAQPPQTAITTHPAPPSPPPPRFQPERADASVHVPNSPPIDCAESTPLERRQTADHLLNQLVTRIRGAAQDAHLRGATAEDVANEHNFYLDGWIDSVLTLGRPAQLHELRESLADTLCGSPSDAEIIALTRLAARIPEMANERGLGCVLAARRDEDVVLANALDAYRQARLPPSPAWERWRDRATSPQIQRRFRSSDVRERVPTEEGRVVEHTSRGESRVGSRENYRR